MKFRKTVTFKNIKILFKTGYCHKCGHKLKVDKEHFYPEVGDEGWSGFFTDDTIIEYKYFCPECGNWVDSKLQDKVGKVQKYLSKRIVSDEEINEFINSSHNISCLEKKKKINLFLFLCNLFLLLTTPFLYVYGYTQNWSYQYLILMLLISISFLGALKSHGGYKYAKRELYQIRFPSNGESIELASLKKGLKRRIVILIFIVVLFIGSIIGLIIVSQRKLIGYILLFILASICFLVGSIEQLLRVVNLWQKLHDYKEYLKNKIN